jgi:hypothetical protein
MTQLPLVWAQTTTSFPANGMPTDTPSSTTGAVMFFAVSAIIFGGALVLYLRNRRPAGPGPDPDRTPGPGATR